MFAITIPSIIILLSVTLLIVGSLAAESNDSYIEGDLFWTTFALYNPSVTIGWSTSGHYTTESGGKSTGCYGTGSLGPFNSPCAIASSAENGKLFVMEANTANSSYMSLYIYDQTESEKPSITLTKTVGFPKLAAGSAAKCFLGLLGTFVYFGTDQSSEYIQMNMKTMEVIARSNTSPPQLTTGITVSRDVVMVNQGTSSYTLYDKEGKAEQYGGGGSLPAVVSGQGYQLH